MSIWQAVCIFFGHIIIDNKVRFDSEKHKRIR